MQDATPLKLAGGDENELVQAMREQIRAYEALDQHINSIDFGDPESVAQGMELTANLEKAHVRVKELLGEG